MEVKPNRVLLAILALLLGALGYWILISPENPLTSLFRSKISDTGARVIVGPYPLEEDFLLLRRNHVQTVVSLLDARLPYEHVLLQREEKLAKQYGMRLLNFPMSSILGQHVGDDYNRNAAAAAEAVHRETGKVYLHCYLGVHRVKTVLDLLQTRGIDTGLYLPRKSERSPQAQLLERAQAEFDAGRYNAALDILKQSALRDIPALMLEGWSQYRLGNMAAARSLFEQALQMDPGNTEAHSALGSCALRQNDTGVAEQQFSAALQISPNDAGALAGMGLLRQRQGRLVEAAKYLETALQIDPRNEEARQVLAKIRAKR